MGEKNDGKGVEKKIDDTSNVVSEKANKNNGPQKEWKCIEETKSNKSNIVKFLVFFLVGVAVLVGAGLLGVKGYELLEASGNNKDKVITEEGANGENAETPVVEATLTVDEVNDLVHLMSNTIIVAADNEIWGKEEITKEKIEDVLVSTKGIDDYLYTEIKKWSELDFNNAVDVHNYVWGKLQGTIGRAVSLNDTEIEKVKNSLIN